MAAMAIPVFSWIFVGLIAVTGGQEGVQCPERCICFSTTVRCMFLELDAVPDNLAADTTVLYVSIEHGDKI